MNLANEATRAWIYRVVTALIPVLTAYGLIDNEKVPVLLALVAAVLSTGMAAVNTSTSGNA